MVEHGRRVPAQSRSASWRLLVAPCASGRPRTGPSGAGSRRRRQGRGRRTRPPPSPGAARAPAASTEVGPSRDALRRCRAPRRAERAPDVLLVRGHVEHRRPDLEAVDRRREAGASSSQRASTSGNGQPTKRATWAADCSSVGGPVRRPSSTSSPTAVRWATTSRTRQPGQAGTGAARPCSSSLLTRARRRTRESS